MIKTNAFRDKECTCKCGNKHEFYGGKGYTTVHHEAYANSYYLHIVKCNKCNAESKLKY